MSGKGDPDSKAPGSSRGSRDITVKKKAGTAIQESQARLQAITDSAQDAIVMMDAQGAISFWNPAAEKILGFRPEEALGRNLHELLAPEHFLEAHRAAFQEFKKTGRGDAVGQTLELTARRKDGQEITVSLSLSAVPHKGSWHAVGILRDVTKLKQAEEALRQSQNRLTMFFNQSIYGYYCSIFDEPLEWNETTDKEKVLDDIADHQFITEINDAMLAQYGATRESMVGRPMSSFFKHDTETGRSGRRKLFDEGHLHLETYEVKDDGTPVWIEGDYQCTYDQQGRIIGTFGVQLDITERKRAEMDNEKLQAQLIQAQKMESVGRLAGGVAHDFNNVLQAILGHVDLALQDVPPESPVKDNLLEIKTCARRSADLTRQLLAFARKQTILPKVLDLNQTINGFLTMLRRLIGENIELAWQPAEDLWPVELDPSQVHQILANLCVNARDAIADIGRITLSTGNCVFDEASAAGRPGVSPGQFVQLTVRDTGCGMDGETLSHLFEPFFTTKALGKGTGLGLATVYGAVKQNQGFINVESSPGQGTTFRIFLPRYAREAQAAAPPGPAPTLERGQETILLVEDEPAILNLTRKLIERLGYTVLAAGTPGEAIRLAEEHSGAVQLLMTDVVMPEMNGLDLAKHLLSRFPNLKRLFMSGYTAEIIAHHGVLGEDVFFLQKPFSRSDLAAKLREVLEPDSKRGSRF